MALIVISILAMPGLDSKGDIRIPDGIAGVHYEYVFPLRGGEGQLTWIADDGLPDEIRLLDMGALSGTPKVVGEYHFAITIQDEVGISIGPVAHVWRILPPSAQDFRIPFEELPAAIVGNAYNAHLYAEGGTKNQRWTIDSDLPPGLQVIGNVIDGTPTKAGNFEISAAVASADGYFEARKTLSITVADPSTPILLEPARVSLFHGLPFEWYPSFDRAVTIGIESESPQWLTHKSGSLRGTAGSTGQYVVMLLVTDALGATTRVEVTLDVRDPPFIQPMQVLDDRIPVVVNETFSHRISITGGLSPYRWNELQPVPGLRLAKGVLSGRIDTSGNYPWVGTAIDALGTLLEVRLVLEVKADTLDSRGTAANDGNNQTAD